MLARVTNNPYSRRRPYPDWAKAGLPSAAKALGEFVEAIASTRRPRAMQPCRRQEPLPPHLWAEGPRFSPGWQGLLAHNCLDLATALRGLANPGEASTASLRAFVTEGKAAVAQLGEAFAAGESLESMTMVILGGISFRANVSVVRSFVPSKSKTSEAHTFLVVVVGAVVAIRRWWWTRITSKSGAQLAVLIADPF
ncbi:hypothetical protein NL676_017557 [Syzygium grande]|nr:hypothetical protein NL676_017557 [Syzygium grande]